MRVKLFLIYLALFSFLYSFPQPEKDNPELLNKIDSLETILHKTSLTEKTKSSLLILCNDLAKLYPELSYEQQLEYTLRLKPYADKFGNTNLDVTLLHILANANFQLDNYEDAIEINYKIFNIYSILNDDISKAQALKEIGNNYYAQNKYFKAKDYYDRALVLFKKNQYFTGIAETMQRIAVIMSHWGEYNEALNYNFESLNFWKEVGDILQIANVNYSIGTIYQELGDLDKAKTCYYKSLSLYKELNSTIELVKTTSRIGDILLQNQQFDEALEYYKQADMIGKKEQSPKLDAEAAFNIGKAYNLKGNYIKAIDYQRKALKINEELGDQKALAENCAELGMVYLNFGLNKKALFYFNKGLAISLHINYKYQTNIYYLNLSEIHAKLHNYEEAYRDYKLYIEGRDQINEEEAKQKTAELQAKYQLSEKDKENESLRHNEQLHRAQIKNQWLLMGLIAVILLGISIMATIFRKRYKQNRRLNVQLSLKNQEIEAHRKKVEHLNADLQEANGAKDRFFSIIAHDLKNPFNALMGLVDLLIEEFHSFNEKEHLEFLQQIKNSSDKIYGLLQNLLLWGRNQLGKTQVFKEKFDLTTVVNEALNLIQSQAGSKSITIQKNIPANTRVYADKTMVSTILLNLVTNAIKFTPQNGIIEVRSFTRSNYVEIMVADSGVGISQKNLEQLFKMNARVQSAGTDNEKGTGLGLILCKEFVEKNNGRIWAESIEGNGSWFYFTLPVSEDSQPVYPAQLKKNKETSEIQNQISLK